MNELVEIAEAERKADYYTEIAGIYRLLAQKLRAAHGHSNGTAKTTPPKQRRSPKAVAVQPQILLRLRFHLLVVAVHRTMLSSF